MATELPVQGSLELGQLGPQLTFGQVGQERRVARATHECLQDLPPGGTKDVAGHVAQLAAGAFQRLVQAIAFIRSLLDQRFTIPRQLAHHADGSWRNEAGLQQAMPQQLGQPLGVSG